MDLFLREATERTGADDALPDRSPFLPVPKRGPGRSGIGPRGYDRPVLFRCLLTGQWHGPGGPGPERALKVRPDFMIFRGPDLHAPVPDGTTRCRFRNALVKGGVHDALPAGACRQIEEHGLKLKEAGAAITDATPVESTARPRTRTGAPEDRAGGEAPDEPKMHFSAGTDAPRVRKGSGSTPPPPVRPGVPGLKPWSKARAHNGCRRTRPVRPGPAARSCAENTGTGSWERRRAIARCAPPGNGSVN